MEIDQAHTLLINSGWTYTGETCGCGGSAKKRSYNRQYDRLIINLRTKLYEINSGGKKPIQDLNQTNL